MNLPKESSTKDTKSTKDLAIHPFGYFFVPFVPFVIFVDSVFTDQILEGMLFIESHLKRAALVTPAVLPFIDLEIDFG